MVGLHDPPLTILSLRVEIEANGIKIASVGATNLDIPRRQQQFR